MGLPSRIAVTIDDHYARLTPMQKSIARYIMSNLADAAFMSIQEMAKACGVSEASILRFARALGYSGFPEFKGDVQDAFRRQVNLVTKFSRKLDSLSEGDHLLSDLVRSEMSQIDQLLAEPHDEVFSGAVKAIACLDHIVVFGEGSSASLTLLLEFRLRRMQYMITRINESGKYFFEKVVHFPQGAAAIAFGLGRPSEELVVFLKQARKHQCPTILITDSYISSIAKEADYVLHATRGSLGVFHSIIVPTLVTEALILGVALERREESLDALDELERLRNAYGYPRYAGLEPES